MSITHRLRRGTGHSADLRRWLVALGSALVVVFASPSAAGAFAIGASNGSSQPGVAVDRVGTAYVAWGGPENGDGPVQFCRLPRGATVCDRRVAITAPGTTLSRAFVVVSGTRVVVVQHRYGALVPQFAAMYQFVSTDGGTSFAAGRVIGTGPSGGRGPDFHEAVVGPGNTLSGIPGASSAFQNVPLDESSPPAATYAELSADHIYGASVGMMDAATPLAIIQDRNGATQFRRYGGSGSINDAAHWTAPVDLGVIAYPKLAGGPSGLFLLATTGEVPYTVVARKWNGTTFGAPVAVAVDVAPPSLHAFQDDGGRLHAIFPPRVGTRLFHAVSDDGITWRSGAVPIADDSSIDAPRVATAADHIGVAVWNAVSAQEIRVAAVGPDAPLTPHAATPLPRPVAPRPPAGAPTITGLSLTRGNFCVGRRCPRSRRGTTLRFALSQPAAIKFGFERRSSGRRANGRCRRATRSNHGGRRCSYYAKAGSFSRPGTAGANSLAFSGRVGGRELQAGSYRLSLTAIAASGARSTTQRVRFRISRPGPARAGNGR